MRYLSFDLEATGLDQNDYIIEFGMIPFDTETRTLEETLARNYYIKCPSFETLKPQLAKWVIDHNEGLIKTAHKEGIDHLSFQKKIEEYLKSPDVQDYFQPSEKNKIMLFGKSVNSIDIPFLNRDLGWGFMKENFDHRVLDLTSTSLTLIDLNLLPDECASGSDLMKYLGLGEVEHTALADARNTAIMYLKLIEIFFNNQRE
jgi:DNA polymerase-3 subunit epsilon